MIYVAVIVILGHPLSLIRVLFISYTHTTLHTNFYQEYLSLCISISSVEYSLLHPAEAAAAISQTRVSMLAAAHAASAKGNSLYPHDSHRNTYEANKTTSTSSRGVSKAAAADADRLLRFSPLHQSSPLTMLSQHSDALFIHALPASAASSDPLLLHAPLPPSMASVTGVWDAAGAMLMWAQVVHAIANEYGDYAHSWVRFDFILL